MRNFPPQDEATDDRRRLDQIPKSSLSVLAVEAIDCALARSSAPFFGVEKP
jgi:hypothetical protein